MAVEKLDAVRSVDTDMNAHTITVAFDDEELSVDAIVQTLNQAGYTVPGYTKAN
ncbi:MAG: heavy-metal-associated domain-containing protein [Deltaproteobacteria bacterium]|nr:heavy-metal-associated domain-containing protein [Deltaproteobacteria bacterium]MCZ6713313.1 heavy-metal-associated domain-containing protein [Deltaproteobacteria bacterium]MCZ6821904.1 heavy-metal-associated domain-containing protein [Deltaproteobacteria bacterium]